MIWSIAWKNVWRNRKRSLIVVCAVLLGTVAGVFTAGLMKGWVAQRLDSVIYTEMSHIRINHPDYLLNEEILYTIPEPEQIEEYLKKCTIAEGVTTRIKITAMAGTSRGNTSMTINGIDVEDEKKVCRVFSKLVPSGGTFFDTPMTTPIVISDKTAEALRIKNYEITGETIDSLQKLSVPEITLTKLRVLVNERFTTEKKFKKGLQDILTHKEIKISGQKIVDTAKHYRLRGKIVLTFNDTGGRLVNQTYRVCGIYKTTNTMFDQLNAYVLKEDLASVAGFQENSYHEISVILSEGADVDRFKSEVKTAFPLLSVLSWKDMSPEAAMMTEFMDIWYVIIMGFILFALAFGIINTMLMAILERVKELGMLMAIGMNKRRVFKMIMLETVFLTLVGAIGGMTIGALIIVITGHSGLNFSSVSEGFEAMGWSALIYPEIDAGFFFMVTLLVVLTGILSSIIPARKALKMNPVEAIRTE